MRRFVVSFAVFLCVVGVAHAQTDRALVGGLPEGAGDSIRVVKPDWLDAVHPRDRATSVYADRVRDVLRAAGLRALHDRTVVQPIDRDTIYSWEAVIPWQELPPSIPTRWLRLPFFWHFSVRGFEEQMAITKSIARRYFDAAWVRASLAYADSTSDAFPEREWPRGVPAVDSLSYRDYRFPDLSARPVQRHLLEIARRGFGAPRRIHTGDSAHTIPRRSLRECHRIDDLEADTWCVNVLDPIVVWAIEPNSWRGGALHTTILVPIQQGYVVRTFAQTHAYAGEVGSFGHRGIDGGYARDEPARPALSLGDAMQLVESHTGEHATRALYTMLLGHGYWNQMAAAVKTADGNVYIVDPIIEAVW